MSAGALPLCSTTSQDDTSLASYNSFADDLVTPRDQTLLKHAEHSRHRQAWEAGSTKAMAECMPHAPCKLKPEAARHGGSAHAAFCTTCGGACRMQLATWYALQSYATPDDSLCQKQTAGSKPIHGKSRRRTNNVQASLDSGSIDAKKKHLDDHQYAFNQLLTTRDSDYPYQIHGCSCSYCTHLYSWGISEISKSKLMGP